MRLVKLFFHLMVSAWLANAVYADDKKTILVGLHDAPLLYFERDGEAAGPVVDWSKKVFQQIGLRPTWRSLPPGRYYKQLSVGAVNLALAPAFIADHHQDLLVGSSLAFRMPVEIFARNPEIPPLEEITPDHVILVLGYSYDQALGGTFPAINSAQSIYATDHRTALALLDSGRAKYMIGLRSWMQALKAQQPDKRLYSRRVTDLRITWVIHQSTPDAQALLRRLDQATKALGPIPPLTFSPDGTIK